MKKNNIFKKEDREAHVKALIVLVITVLGLVCWYLKPKSPNDFKNLNHNYTKGVITRANYLKGKSNRVHEYEFEVNGVNYHGIIGYLKMNASVGDSCMIIYDLYNPERNTIYSMDTKRDNQLNGNY